MNNSFAIHQANQFSVENTPVVSTEEIKKRESELVKIIEALKEVQSSKAWSTLKTKVFDSLPGELSQQLTQEAQKPTPDTLRLNRLAGQLKWAEKFSDLTKLEDIFRLELKQLRIYLHGQTTKES